MVYGVAVLAAIVAISGLACAIRFRYVFPYWDMATVEIAYFSGHPLSFWIPADNEHLPLFAMPLFWLDNVLFRAHGVLTQALMLMLAAWMGLVWAARALRASRGDVPVTIACASVFVALLLSLQNWENLIWPKQIHMYLSLASFVGAGCLVARAGPPSRGRVAGVGALLIVSIFSFAYGVVAWVAVLCLALARGWPRRGLAALLATFACCLIVYSLLYNRLTIRAYGNPLDSLLHPGLLARYELTYAAAPFIHLAGAWPVFGDPSAAGRLVTAFLLIALLPSAWSTLRRPPDETLTWSWLLILFTLGTGLISAMARARSFGTDQALSSRYFVAQVPLWIGLCLLGIQAFGARRTWRRVCVASVGLLLVALLASADRDELPGLRLTQANHYQAVLALLDGVQDQPVLQAHLVPFGDLAWTLGAELRRRRWSVFDWRESHWIGQRFDALFAPAGPYACDGLIGTTAPVAGTNARFLTGWAWDRKQRAPVRWIVLVDREGVVRGLGHGGLFREGLGRLLYDPAANDAGWQGYAPVPGLRAYAVVDRERAACPLAPRT